LRLFANSLSLACGGGCRCILRQAKANILARPSTVTSQHTESGSHFEPWFDRKFALAVSPPLSYVVRPLVYHVSKRSSRKMEKERNTASLGTDGRHAVLEDSVYARQAGSFTSRAL
jgi:hypothetical protein